MNKRFEDIDSAIALHYPITGQRFTRKICHGGSRWPWRRLIYRLPAQCTTGPHRRFLGQQRGMACAPAESGLGQRTGYLNKTMTRLCTPPLDLMFFAMHAPIALTQKLKAINPCHPFLCSGPRAVIPMNRTGIRVDDSNAAADPAWHLVHSMALGHGNLPGGSDRRPGPGHG